MHKLYLMSEQINGQFKQSLIYAEHFVEQLLLTGREFFSLLGVSTIHVPFSFRDEHRINCIASFLWDAEIHQFHALFVAFREHGDRNLLQHELLGGFP